MLIVPFRTGSTGLTSTNLLQTIQFSSQRTRAKSARVTKNMKREGQSIDVGSNGEKYGDRGLIMT